MIRSVLCSSVRNLRASASVIGGKGGLRNFGSDPEYKPPFSNEPDDYRRLMKVIEEERKGFLESPTRFQRISEREDRTDIPFSVNLIKRNFKSKPVYRGLVVLKSPEDFVTYHQLFWYVKPPTIIELGTNTGGMAVWISDTMKLIDNPCQIYSVDIDNSLLSPDVLKIKPSNVNFIQGDCYALEKTLTPDFLRGLPHPWVIIDDAHVNIPNVLEYFHEFLQEGDYFVVEDTDPTSVPRLGEDKDNFGETGIGTGLLDQLKYFMSKYEDQYAVDSFLNDMFGYNGTWHWHGFVRRMK